MTADLSSCAIDPNGVPQGTLLSVRLPDWADRWRVAGDYLKEHWSPDQEPDGALTYLTSFCIDDDLTLFTLGVPYWIESNVYMNEKYKDRMMPRFTPTMGRHLSRVGIRLWHDVALLTADPAEFTVHRTTLPRHLVVGAIGNDLHLVNYP